MKEISIKITPEERKKIELFKRLSVEEHFVLNKKRTIFNSFLIGFILSLIVMNPFNFFITSLDLGFDFYTSYSVFVLALINVLLGAIFFGLVLYLFRFVIDYSTEKYTHRGKLVIKKLKEQYKKWTSTY